MTPILPGNRVVTLAIGAAFATAAFASIPAHAAPCAVEHAKLQQALKANVKPSGGPANGGFENNEWAVVIDRAGIVCAVAFSGNVVGDQWLASRAIAAEKANTANALSVPKYAISTANIYAASQPGGYLYGTAITNPPDPSVIYAGNAATWGSANDPMLGKKPGGVVDYGGGFALYNASGVIGALGVSGDTPCADANVAWRVRHALGLDKVPNGPSPGHNDAVIYDIGPGGKSASGFGQPKCGKGAAEIAQKIGAGYIGQQGATAPPVTAPGTRAHAASGNAGAGASGNNPH
jgi:uncharacterized protein GlcG (DUF336 family)